MDLDRQLEQLELQPTPVVYAAMCYLEKHGKKFLVDFGTQNAVAIADSMKRLRRREGALRMHHRHRKARKAQRS